MRNRVTLSIVYVWVVAPMFDSGRLLPKAFAQDEPANLCVNPGFERLNPAGDNFPLNWGAVRRPPDRASVTIDKATHEGGIAVRMSAQASGVAGLISDEISVRKGVVTFRYKAMKSFAAGDNLRMYVIAVSKGAGEVARTSFAVPTDQVCDGQLH